MSEGRSWRCRGDWCEAGLLKRRVLTVTMAADFDTHLQTIQRKRSKEGIALQSHGISSSDLSIVAW